MEFVLEWPQWIYIILAFLGVLIHTVNHGDEMKGKYNGFSRIVFSAFLLFVLFQGGFFTA